MSLSLGVSPNTSNTPQQYFSPFALSYKGGAYSFNGTSTEVPGTFYFDLSDIVTNTTTVDNSSFYLMGYDNLSGTPLTLSSFEIIDGITGLTLTGATGLPITLDQSNKTIKIGSYMGDSTPPTSPTNLTYTTSTVTSK
jgi:hypothetical protein